MKSELLLEISRVKNLMGLLIESETRTISDEASFIKYLIDNGFKKIDPNNPQEVKMIEDKFLPSKFYLKDTELFYFNEKNNSYFLKWNKNSIVKEKLTLGTLGNYIPKKGERIPKTSISIKFPMRLDWIDEFVKPEFDLEWDAQSLSHRLDTAKNSYHNFLFLNNKGEIVQKDTNKILDKKYIEGYKKGIKHVLDEVESLLPKLSKQEQSKPITSIKFGTNYSKISDYIDEVKNDASKLGLFDMPIASKTNNITTPTQNNTKQTNDIQGFIVEPIED